MFKADLRQEQQQISYSSSENDGQQQTAMSHQGESHVLQTYHVQLQQEQVEGVHSQEQQSVAVPVHLQQLQTYYVSRPELAVTQHQPLDQAQMQQVIQQYKYQEQHSRQQLVVQQDQPQPQLQRSLQVKCVQHQHVGVQHKKQQVLQKHSPQLLQLQQKHQQVQQKNVLHSQQYVQQKTGQDLHQLQQQHKVDADKLQMHVQHLSHHQKLQVHSLQPNNQQQQKQKMQVLVVKHKSHQELDVDQQQQNLKVQHVLLQHSRQQPGLQATFPLVQLPTTSEQQVQTTGAKLSLSVDDVAKKIADNVCQAVEREVEQQITACTHPELSTPQNDAKPSYHELTPPRVQNNQSSSSVLFQPQYSP